MTWEDIWGVVHKMSLTDARLLEEPKFVEDWKWQMFCTEKVIFTRCPETAARLEKGRAPTCFWCSIGRSR